MAEEPLVNVWVTALFFQGCYTSDSVLVAKEHDLITNCLKCGKIICKMEGYGPCSFCGSAVELQGDGRRNDSKLSQMDSLRARMLNQPTRATVIGRSVFFLQNSAHE